MNRREFSKRVALLGAGLSAQPAWGQPVEAKESPEGWFEEPARKLPVRKFDVVVAGGGTYGIPYKALRVAGIENLLVAGMLITSNHDAHMSTRNTVCCMGQGQAAGTAAAMCAAESCGTRELAYPILRKALLKAGVHLES